MKLLQFASKGVRESASCIVVQKIDNECFCSHNHYDYRMLFVKRHSKMKSWPGTTTFPGGVIDKDDLHGISNFSQISELLQFGKEKISYTEQVYRQTALRELSEETDFPKTDNINHLIPWSIWQTPLSFKKRFNAIFYLMFVDSKNFNLNPQEGEIESVHWFSPSEVLDDVSISLAFPQLNDISKFCHFKTYNELQKFANYRYKNFRTIQCMPVIMKFSDGVCGILSQDSFYIDALSMQLKDTSKELEIDNTINDHNSKQQFLHRSVLTKTGVSYVASNIGTLKDGHRLPITACSAMMTYKNEIIDE